MGTTGTPRRLVVGAVLAGLVAWTVVSAATGKGGYPNGEILVTGPWLRSHLRDPGLVIVDVRADKDFDGRVIPGALRLPWSAFRENDPVRDLGGLFVGAAAAQQVLGRHGVARTDTVVLYDSVKKDGGAVASYVFWVLDLLGHPSVKVLERGLDGWVDAGGEVVSEPARPEPVTYQAPAAEVRLRRWADGEFLRARLGDPVYQVLDVRSAPEYLGEKANATLSGREEKRGHVPGAYNVDYRLNWTDPDRKAVRPYGELLELYRGLDPARPVIVYCHSGRRASFGYFVLRLLGFDDVLLYDGSWMEWGHPDRFFPVETTPRELRGALPVPGRKAAAEPRGAGRGRPAARAEGGYISCGG
ncbi:MAG: sulfurtransferase [Deferrisomatales bacterium]